MEPTDLAPDPLRQLASWLEEARRAGAPMPEAMALATASATGSPSLRMVIMRGLDNGLVFYTDDRSAKGADLRDNPRASALFHWLVPAHRQVRITGPVSDVSDGESDAYWAGRPPAFRLSAAATRQSEVVESRAVLLAALDALTRATGKDDAVARPTRWHGQRIVPDTVELWQEGPHRLHDRLRYRAGPGGWVIERLAP